MMKKQAKRRALYTGLAVLILIGGGAGLVARKHARLARAPRYERDPVPVRVTVAERGALTIGRPMVATVEPVRRAELGARLTAEVREVRWTEGDRVLQGEPGLLLDDRDLRQQLAAAEAAIAEAQSEGASRTAQRDTAQRSVVFWEAETDRIRTLARNQHAAASEVAAMEERLNEARGRRLTAEHQHGALLSRIDQLRARRDEASARLAYARLSAPFDGVVTRRLVDPGDLAVPGKLLLVVEETARLRLAFDLPQPDLARVQPGTEAIVNGPHGPHRLRVSHIHPALSDHRTVRVWIDVDDALHGQVQSGQYLSVTLVLETLEDAVLLPRASIVEQEGQAPFVYIVANDRLTVRPVSVQGREGEKAAVTGVAPGEQVVRYTFMDWARIAAGRPVEIWP